MNLADCYARTPTWMTVAGSRVPAHFGDLAAEVAAIRRSAALSDRGDVTCLRLSGKGAWDVLSHVCPANLFLRDAQLRHSLLLDESGKVLADLYVGTDDDTFLLLAEGLDSTELCRHITTHTPKTAEVELERLEQSHHLIGLDGPFAWEVLAKLEGPDIAGFPFHTCYHPQEGATYFRLGKTGEYGYALLVPEPEAPALWQRLLEAGAACSLREVGLEALWHASLENWFFNIHREGQVAELTPVELQLQWRLSSEPRDWVGQRSLRARRPTHRIVALCGSAPLSNGAAITFEDRPIGTVLLAAQSLTLSLPIGIGLIQREYAYSGIDRFKAAGVPIRTVSPPFVNNLSLYVDPQQDAWATRDEIPYDGPLAAGIGAP